MQELLSSGQRVKRVVEVAGAFQRSQAAVRRLEQAAPWAAAGVFVSAVIGRVLGYSWMIPLATAALAALALTVAVVLWRRPRPSSDRVAAEMDTAGALGGELRSAHWFASTPTADPWTQFHIERAAARGESVAWSNIFPTVVHRRPWLLAAGLVAIAFAVPVAVPAGRALAGSGQTVSASEAEAAVADLPPELQEAVEELIAAVERGSISSNAAMAELAAGKEWPKLDKATQDRLRNLLNRVELASQEARGKPAPEPRTSADQEEWVREELSARRAMEEAEKAGRGTEEKSGQDSQPQSGSTQDSAESQAGEASDFQAAAVQREVPDGTGDASAMAISQDKPAKGEAGTGLGGKRGDVTRADVRVAELNAAFKRETVDANVNASGDQPVSDDRRRDTESGESSLRYTRVAGRASFDRARADAPHTVPEARRLLLERYFVRTETPR